MEIEELKEELKKYLKQPRYEHSLSVMKVSAELAKKYKIDEQKIMKTALMHDIAKEMSIQELKKYIIKNKILTSKIEMIIGATLHGKVGADICKKKYGFDEKMCKAISIHTTGKPKMSLFEKIIFIADKIDYTRKYEGVEELRKLAYEDIDEAIIKNIEYNLLSKIDRKMLILEDSIKTRNYILINKKK